MLDYAPGLLTKKKLFLSCLYQLFWHSSQKLTDKGTLQKEGSTGENKIQFFLGVLAKCNTVHQWNFHFSLIYVMNSCFTYTWHYLLFWNLIDVILSFIQENLKSYALFK